MLLCHLKSFSFSRYLKIFKLQYIYYLVSQEVHAVNTVERGQLIEHNMRNIFLETYTKCGVETRPRSFLRN